MGVLRWWSNSYAIQLLYSTYVFSFLNLRCLGFEGACVNAHVNNELPQFIADIFGKTFIFQLKLGEFNFTLKHQTFTISCINPF